MLAHGQFRRQAAKTRMLIKTIIKASRLVSLLFLCSTLMGQSALVKRATVETFDGVIFRIWTTNQEVKNGDKIEVNYQVENRSPKSIYLVTENPMETEIKGRTILILAPYISDEHEASGSEYSLIEIKRGRKREGKFIITKNDYREAREWSIDVTFGFVRDIKGFKQRIVHPTEKRALGNITEVVGVGTLDVDVQ